MIYCKISKARCKCTWVKCLSSAGAYHGEILGGLMMQLILNAAASGYHSAIPPVVVDCDNNRVISHGNAPLQADVLCTLKHLVSVHSASYLSTCNCTQMKQRNGAIAYWRNISTLRWIDLQRRLSRLSTAPGNSLKVLFRTNKYGLNGRGKGYRFPLVGTGGIMGTFYTIKD
jgi:hypothetical protein